VDDEAWVRVVLDGLAGALVDGAPDDGRLVVRLAAPVTAGSMNAALVSAGVEVSELAAEHERLEDVFMELVGEGEAHPDPVAGEPARGNEPDGGR
jgi:hypothetical protein